MSAMNYGRQHLLFGMPSASQLVVRTGVATVEDRDTE